MPTTRELALADGDIYTLHEISDRTVRVFEQIMESGRPAGVTLHGRFIALITPIEDGEVESVALTTGSLADQLEAVDAAHFSSEHARTVVGDSPRP